MGAYLMIFLALIVFSTSWADTPVKVYEEMCFQNSEALTAGTIVETDSGYYFGYSSERFIGGNIKATSQIRKIDRLEDPSKIVAELPDYWRIEKILESPNGTLTTFGLGLRQECSEHGDDILGTEISPQNGATKPILKWNRLGGFGFSFGPVSAVISSTGIPYAIAYSSSGPAEYDTHGWTFLRPKSSGTTNWEPTYIDFRYPWSDPYELMINQKDVLFAFGVVGSGHLGIQMSSDGGLTWQSLKRFYCGGVCGVASAIIASNGDIYVAYTKSLFLFKPKVVIERSENNGVDWKVDSEIPSESTSDVNALQVLPNGDQYLQVEEVGTNINTGMYLRKHGEKWKKVAELDDHPYGVRTLLSRRKEILGIRTVHYHANATMKYRQCIQTFGIATTQ